MTIGAKRRSPTWQQSLLLVIFGVVVGYPSFLGATHGMWSGDVSPFQGLAVVGFFASAVAFLSGFASFFAIAVKAVTSPLGSAPSVATLPPTSTGAISPATHPQFFPEVAAKRQGSAALNASTALALLRITLIALIALDYLVLRDWGRPPLTSSYGRSYWLIEILTLLLTQLPYIVTLIRIWRLPDGVGLALAMAGGSIQVLSTFVLDPPDQSWLRALLGVAAVAFAYLAWRSRKSRKGDAGLLISIFVGFLTYEVLIRTAVALLFYRLVR